MISENENRTVLNERVFGARKITVNFLCKWKQMTNTIFAQTSNVSMKNNNCKWLETKRKWEQWKQLAEFIQPPI